MSVPTGVLVSVLVGVLVAEPVGVYIAVAVGVPNGPLYEAEIACVPGATVIKAYGRLWMSFVE